MLQNYRILISDNDETLSYLLKEELINEGFLVDVVYDFNSTLTRLKNLSYDILLLEIEIFDTSYKQLFNELRETAPNTLIIILTNKSDIKTIVEYIKAGAYDFIPKPYQFDSLLNILDKAIKVKKKVNTSNIDEADSPFSSKRIIGESQQIISLLEFVHKAAKSDSNILIEGETGTGKELFADFIHKKSSRSHKPFVVINCASLPDQLIESELFGYEKGAFTDAKTSKQGLVEIADGGTLFLDEIGEMSLSLQPKLLRFIENGEFRRIGGINTLTSNVRIIAATNRNLMQESEQKTFRRDLLFRLNVFTFSLPPLRERGSDIILLAEYFLKIKNGNESIKVLSENAKHALKNHNYPGNIRELNHIIQRAIVFSDNNIIDEKDLYLSKSPTTFEEYSITSSDNINTLDDMEREHIQNVLIHFNWNREESARALGVSQKTLYTKILKYELRK